MRTGAWTKNESMAKTSEADDDAKDDDSEFKLKSEMASIWPVTAARQSRTL